MGGQTARVSPAVRQVAARSSGGMKTPLTSTRWVQFGRQLEGAPDFGHGGALGHLDLDPVGLGPGRQIVGQGGVELDGDVHRRPSAVGTLAGHVGPSTKRVGVSFRRAFHWPRRVRLWIRPAQGADVFGEADGGGAPTRTSSWNCRLM